MKYQVTRTDGETGKVTNCGGAVKTLPKANDLRSAVRMSARVTQPGHSNSYSIKVV